MGLHDEIVEQPRVARRLLSEATNEVNKVAAAVQAIDPAGAFAAARGTSDHAATYLKYLLEGRNEFPVALAAPSVFTLYGRAPRVYRFLVLGISQSGAPEDVVTVVRSARSQGALTVAVTNEPGSDLAQAAEHVLHCRAGTERSVAATKTYTSTLLLTALLATAMSGDEELAEAVHRVPTAMQLVLDAEDRIAAVAEVLPFERMVVLGRGFQLATALETALKITETSYVMAEGKSSADFLHGPIAMTEPGFPVLLFFVRAHPWHHAEARDHARRSRSSRRPNHRRPRSGAVCEDGPPGDRAARALGASRVRGRGPAVRLPLRDSTRP